MKNEFIPSVYEDFFTGIFLGDNKYLENRNI